MMNYPPNVEAVEYFVRDILPLVRNRVPGVLFNIVGNRPGPLVWALNSEKVVVHGGVPDLRPYYHGASVVVVPLLQGGGTRNKILEAGACGNAIVSTSLGAEGLSFEAGRDLLIADTPVEFAEAISRVCADNELRGRLGHGAREAAATYDWKPVGARWLAIVNEYGAPVS